MVNIIFANQGHISITTGHVVCGDLSAGLGDCNVSARKWSMCTSGVGTLNKLGSQ